MEEAKATLKEMLTGIVILAVLVVGIGIWFAGDCKLSYALGVLLGGTAASGFLLHMYRSLDEMLDLDPDTAKKYARRKSVTRLVMMGLVVGLSGVFPDIFHPIGVILGIMTLKFCAYLQPSVHKYIYNKKENE